MVKESSFLKHVAAKSYANLFILNILDKTKIALNGSIGFVVKRQIFILLKIVSYY